MGCALSASHCRMLIAMLTLLFVTLSPAFFVAFLAIGAIVAADNADLTLGLFASADAQGTNAYYLALFWTVALDDAAMPVRTMNDVVFSGRWNRQGGDGAEC